MKFFLPERIESYIPLILSAAFSTDIVTPILLSIISGLVVISLSREISYKVKFSNTFVSSFEFDAFSSGFGTSFDFVISFGDFVEEGIEMNSA